MNPDPSLLHDPERHFGFTQCHGCTGKPCMRLHQGHIRQGEFFFVSRRLMGVELCPFTTHSLRAIARFLTTLDMYRLSRHYSRIVCQLTEIERGRANPEAFINGWDDHGGIIEFLMHLLDHRIIVAVGVPYNFANDLQIKNWFYRFDPAPKSNKSNSGEALTNRQNVSVSQNTPQWTQSDADRKLSDHCTSRG